MNDNSRRVLHLIAGGYLIYLGVNLIMQQMEQLTSNAPVAIGGAILFIGFGIYLVIRFLKQGISQYKEQEEKEESVEVIEENVEEKVEE